MGSKMRAKAKWLHQGEKPSKFFCTLERKNFIDKTIRKINLPNGQILTKQNKILNHVKQFYADLFRSGDSIIPEINLDKVLENCNVTKLSPAEASSLEVKELGKVLLNMKNNKTPDMDGFPVEFFKVFWCDLKFFILRAINRCYEKGLLSISLCSAVITCIPKGDKSRELETNFSFE